MQVRDLIKELEKFPPTHEVVVETDEAFDEIISIEHLNNAATKGQVRIIVSEE